jgi:hypothetical protein
MSAVIEQLHFKVELAGTYWAKHPVYTVLFNGTVVKTEEITSPNGESFFVEFDQEVTEGTTYQLQVRLENKADSDTVENEDKTAIIKDMMLHIRSIEIDEINLGDLVWKNGLFTGDDPARPVLDQCVDLGWNGTWVLEFESPFYIWLLENI